MLNGLLLFTALSKVGPKSNIPPKIKSKKSWNWLVILICLHRFDQLNMKRTLLQEAEMETWKNLWDHINLIYFWWVLSYWNHCAQPHYDRKTSFFLGTSIIICFQIYGQLIDSFISFPIEFDMREKICQPQLWTLLEFAGGRRRGVITSSPIFCIDSYHFCGILMLVLAN